MGGNDSLKTPPENLKDAIDWILWFHGYGEGSMNMNKYKKLATALNTHPEFENAKKKAFANKDPEGVIRNLGTNLGSRFMGHISQGGSFNFSGSGIIVNGRNYTSEYQTASWDGSDDAKDMARIFLGAAAITFWGLSFMYHQCTIAQGWGVDKLAGGSTRLGPFMTTMGYQSNYLDSGKKGAAVASLLEENAKGFDGLLKHDGYTPYYNFIEKLQTQYNPQQNALNSPLTASYIAAKEYFSAQFGNGEVVDETLKAVKKQLEAFKASCGLLYVDLKTAVNALLPNVSSHSQSSQAPSSQFSPAGPVAGTLTTFGLGGGAAAAYLLNLGGAKTLVNGLLKIG
ncbi:uncharacterized protein BcabD6B2_25830 [Babesia caballi]|uniref:Uncharacterized protein n=1 Tax=Babesia caballi TaxID=5871 RepID=A0AAV4LSL9_BABCB|nr:hypothetical protein, conserved [Babesia caballi]